MKKLIPFIFMAMYLLLTGNALAATSAPARNIAVEEANRKLVLEFYDRFFNRHETISAAKVIANNYRQHNPGVPDGKAPFVTFFTDYFRDNPQSRVRIVRSAAHGDLVWLQIHSTNGSKDRGQAVIDIFRVDKGKIVEHWDVIQDVPEKSSNNNTMF
ncbi:ester cyclase [Serratia ureilytica]|uniref:nuclear transport factor 2 family protein n=1 Tax=Serratia ureilytica TaxID=300181 RepID=UPI0018E756AA|nr:ester cyclase [Serratia ureilytica]MBJ2114428.1 ester cyclase [Serratia ureilytica]